MTAGTLTPSDPEWSEKVRSRYKRMRNPTLMRRWSRRALSASFEGLSISQLRPDLKPVLLWSAASVHGSTLRGVTGVEGRNQ